MVLFRAIRTPELDWHGWKGTGYDKFAGFSGGRFDTGDRRAAVWIRDELEDFDGEAEIETMAAGVVEGVKGVTVCQGGISVGSASNVGELNVRGEADFVEPVEEGGCENHSG